MYKISRKMHNASDKVFYIHLLFPGDLPAKQQKLLW